MKPPVPVFGVNGSYATALYSAASNQNALEAVEKDLSKLQSALKEDAKFQDFVRNPIIKRHQKAKVMKNVSSKMSLHPHTANLLQLLAENGRLRNLNGIINTFKRIMVAYRGEVACEVITARELDPVQKQKLEEVLKKFVNANESINLSLKVDPSIMGGIMVSIGDRFVDMSVATKMRKYTKLISIPG
ncbi:OSCP domain containing protein [Asbolus verrucosus]|uniref:Oligomycin sensitivity conferral protein n=1 Tax=Asbolus verrucosus TaxID=1661398 RepID=A0A482VZU0_ASBVE|nr:OSCP domain containing protein [Asbolus verrucosus]